MNEKNIRKYAELMKELDLSGLEITEDNKVVRLERNLSPVAVEKTVVETTAPILPDSNSNNNGDYVSVNSSIVGVFYAAPAENAEPYVSIGDNVKKGQVLCIIEAMKLMNEITAETDGVISEICVTNGQVVEFGTELFRIKR